MRAATFMKHKLTGKLARDGPKPHTGQKEPAHAHGLPDLEEGMRRLDLSEVIELETNFHVSLD